MTSPTIQDPRTPWTPYTRLQLRDLALRQTGVRDPAITVASSMIPVASDEEVSIMDGFLGEALTEIATLLDRYVMLAETSVTADGDFTAVLLPSDFGVICDAGVHVSGYPVEIVKTEAWLRSRRPTSEGGGTYLTDVSGEPGSTRLVGRIVPAKPANDAAVKRMALFLYPVQTAAWTAEIAYRAIAAAYGATTDTLRLPLGFNRLVLLFTAARGAEHRGDDDGAAKRWNLYRTARVEIENISPSEEQGSCLVQGYPEDA